MDMFLYVYILGYVYTNFGVSAMSQYRVTKMAFFYLGTFLLRVDLKIDMESTYTVI